MHPVAARHRRYRMVRGAARFRFARATASAVVRTARRVGQRRFIDEQVARLETSRFRDVNPQQVANDLEASGYALGLRLDHDVIHAVLDYARSSPVFADRNPSQGFLLSDRSVVERSLGRPVLIAQYFNTLRNCAQVRELATDPVLLLIAARYLGVPARLVGANLWWTFPVAASLEERQRHAHFFHRDVDDFRFVKFFFYLTDVEPGDGGHVLVKGSHRIPPHLRALDRFALRRFEDQEVERFYGADRVVEITGPAGTGFVEDTFCVHKGLTPVESPRLLLQFEYAMFDYGVAHDGRAPEELMLIETEEVA